MKPLLVLIVVFVTSLVVFKFRTKTYLFRRSARIAMSTMLLFTAIGHFVFSKGMALMLPDFIPFKLAIVYITGILEIMAAVFLLIPTYRIATGWFLILFFIVLLPANINAAIHGLNYQTGNTDGPGIEYLWFRIPLQLLFIGWVYFATLQKKQA